MTTTRTGCWHYPVHSQDECPNWLEPPSEAKWSQLGNSGAATATMVTDFLPSGHSSGYAEGRVIDDPLSLGTYMEPQITWHLLVDPFSGSFPLCGSSKATARTMNKAKVTCSDCLSLMSSPKAIESEARTAALQAEAEAQWRRSEPRLAAYMDSLKPVDVTGIMETRATGQRSRYPNGQMRRLIRGEVERLPLLRRLLRWWKGVS